MTEQTLLTINSRAVRRELSDWIWERCWSMGPKKKTKRNIQSVTVSSHEEKILHLRGQLQADDDCALELASHDPLVMQRLLSIEANIIAAARARVVKSKDDED
jgi:hypothetical protein